MYENVHPNLALVLLFIRTEVEYRKGLWKPILFKYIIIILVDVSTLNTVNGIGHEMVLGVVSGQTL